MMKRSFHISALFGMLAFIPVALLCQGCDEMDAELTSEIVWSDVPVVFGSCSDGLLIGGPEETKVVTETTTELVNTTDNTGTFKFNAVYHYPDGVNTLAWTNQTAANLSGIFKPYYPSAAQLKWPDQLVTWPRNGILDFYGLWPVSYAFDGGRQGDGVYDFMVNCGSSATPFNCTDDVVIAKNCGLTLESTGGTGQVPITFYHIMSYLYRVNAKVNDSPSSPGTLTASVTSLKVSAPGYGTYHVSPAAEAVLDGHWDISGTQSKNVISSSKNITSTMVKINDDNFAFIPTSNGSYAFIISYSLLLDGVSYMSYTDKVFYVDLVMGQKTTVNIEFNDNGSLEVNEIVGEFFENLPSETIVE